MITLKNIYKLLFLLGIFFIPFNSFEGIKELGEFKKESGAYFLLLGLVFLGLDILLSRKISIPYKNYIITILWVFLLWCIFSVVVNFPFIQESYYKKTTGINRFIRQYFVIIMSGVAFFMLYWNVIVKMSAKEILLMIRKVFLYSFIVVSIYGFLEILYIYFGVYPAYTLLRLFDYFPFTEYDYDVNRRISSVTFEAPALGLYLITVAGWMFSYIITHKGYVRYIPTLVVIILTYYSGSRTALIVITLQAVVFFGIILNNRQKLMAISGIAAMFVLFGTMIVVFKGDKIINDMGKKLESLDFKSNLKKNISNQSRFGIQYANMMVFKENPIVGVGYGQQAFHALNYYPIWAKKDNYEFPYIYLNKNNPMFPPGYNIYVRLLAETGIIGFSIFIYLLYQIGKQSVRIIKNSEDEIKILGIIILVSLIGFIMNWFQSDTFRMYGFWICLAILIRISDLNAIQNKLNKNTHK
ncbi:MULTISPECIES: O-antigen ligase [Flavobacterium]|uniref:O-antigen ligase family protein n=1 Tax=Flavobacterium supellecticarium TaxID=2565924 RepID=A0A4S3ZQ40_9FLAO|nr:O-antigen ligase family protein [Flavobacterium supellecticarium]THF47645.1 O-antigen ligase family protein [Flavobacterium supellecticarium]